MFASDEFDNELSQSSPTGTMWSCFQMEVFQPALTLEQLVELDEDVDKMMLGEIKCCSG